MMEDPTMNSSDGNTTAETRFVTVTLKPALHRTLVTHYLAVGYQNRTEEPERIDPAGIGVNITRSLHQFNRPTHSIILLGDDAMGHAYQALVSQEGFEVTTIRAKGQTETDTCILDTGNDQETHIFSKGLHVTDSDIQRVIQTVQEIVRADDIVILAGALPDGMPEDTYAGLIDAIHATGAEAMVVTGGPELDAALKSRPELVALGQLECESFFDHPVRVLPDVLTAGRKLHERGAGKALVQMQENQGAVLYSPEGQWKLDLPADTQGTRSGVWEALLAGYLVGRADRESLSESLVEGAAAAAYTADQVGNEFGSSTETKAYRTDVNVEPLDEEAGQSLEP
jgi:1-phosphofructokinase